MWGLHPQPGYVSQLKKWQKRHKPEMKAVHNNLDTLLKALQQGQTVAASRFGFIHREGEGLLAIDQSGAGGHVRETRLYIYPDEVQECVYVITIGDKDSQARDLMACRDFVKSIRKGEIAPAIGEKPNVHEEKI